MISSRSFLRLSGKAGGRWRPVVAVSTIVSTLRRMQDGLPVGCYVKAGSDRCNGGCAAVVELRPGRFKSSSCPPTAALWCIGERTAGWRGAVCGDRQQHVRPRRRTVADGIPSAVARLTLSERLCDKHRVGQAAKFVWIRPQTRGRRHHPRRHGDRSVRRHCRVLCSGSDAERPAFRSIPRGAPPRVTA